MVNGRTNISMKTIFFDYLNVHEHPSAIIAHLPRGGQSHLKWVPIYVDGFET